MSPGVSQKTSRRRLRADKFARWVVSAGGLGIIASILGILAFLVFEALPLIGGADRADWEAGPKVVGDDLSCVLTDETKTRFVSIDAATGILRVGQTDTGEIQQTKNLLGDDSTVRIVETRTLGSNAVALLVGDGRILVQSWKWKEDRAKDPVEITAELAEPFTTKPMDAAIPRVWTAAIEPEEGSIKVLAMKPNGELVVDTATFSENVITGETEADSSRDTIEVRDDLTALALDQGLDELYATTSNGELLWWTLTSENAPRRVKRSGPRITTIGLLLGDNSLILGGDDGSLTQWFATRANSEDLQLTEIRKFDPMPGKIYQIGSSRRNKAFVVTDDAGHVGYYYGTTGTRSFVGETPLGSVRSAQLTPKNDGIVVAGEDGFVLAALDDPHPEASLDTYFTKVWYEGYESPSYEWESTGGTNEFEPKLSIIPLVFGTLKATIFSMFLSIPLAVLGAMFVSQFMHPRMRALVKPAIEIMAAMPSVILGFVAALWLAPLLEVGFTSFLLMFLVLPISVVLAGMLWIRVPARIRRRYAMGSEVVIFILALVAGIGVCVALDDPIEGLLFGGDFPSWVYNTLGLDYEQRNSVVIAIAMSFAVVPIIFSISEDAFSNVPRNLVSGSLALGANRWQTVTRVVLPTASPGIFSATMVGFGRAIGETMIVLMATGNTAIMEWNPFNGFRTLSANIATEAPEAPVGGTLYRTLFLTALLLFVLTFVINTLAEVVRIRLRKRYASL